MSDRQNSRKDAARELYRYVNNRFHRDRLGELGIAPDDGRATADLLIEIGTALMSGSWEGIRRAHDALTEKNRGREERLLRALGVCGWALWAWKTGMGRKGDERTKTHQKRIERYGDAQKRVVESLVNGIAEEDPTWGRQSLLDARASLKGEAERTRPSPVRLLRALGAFTSASDRMLEKMHKRLRKQMRQNGT